MRTCRLTTMTTKLALHLCIKHGSEILSVPDDDESNEIISARDALKARMRISSRKLFTRRYGT